MRFLRFLDGKYEFFMKKMYKTAFFLVVSILHPNFHLIMIKLCFVRFSLIFPDSCFVRFSGKKS